MATKPLEHVPQERSQLLARRAAGSAWFNQRVSHSSADACGVCMRPAPLPQNRVKAWSPLHAATTVLRACPLVAERFSPRF